MSYDYAGNVALIAIFICNIPGMVLATTAHEFTRAAVSTVLGDQTPRRDGKLTLNPMKHFEPIGFLLLFYTQGFGWGMPVETSTIHYKDKKTCMVLTAVMPILVNILLAGIFMAVNHYMVHTTNEYIQMALHALIYYNVALAVYNLAPVVPMDGARVLQALLPANHYFQYLRYEKTIQGIFLIMILLGYMNGFFVRMIHFVYIFLEKAFLIL